MPIHSTSARRLCGLLACFVVFGGTGTTLRASEPDARATLKSQLRKHLSASEFKRLWRRPEVRRALEDALTDFDPRSDDRIVVRRSGRTLRITVIDRVRTRVCAEVDRTAESGEEPRCRENVETRQRRTVSLDPQTWRKTRRKTAPPPKRQRGKVLPSVLATGYDRKMRMGPSGVSPELTRLRAGYWKFREAVAHMGSWKDPLEPSFRLGDTLSPVKLPRRRRPEAVGSVEGNAMENLRYIYDISRMRPAWPVPDPFGLAARPTHKVDAAPTALPAPDALCQKMFSRPGFSSVAPRLGCFAQALRARRLGNDGVYEAARWIASVIKVPVLDELLRQRVKLARHETVSTFLWSLSWLRWATRHPAKLGPALRALSPNELMQLRWRLRRWWKAPRHHDLAEVISTLYEEHFPVLYANVKDNHGWPARDRFKDDYLWALNWLARSERRPSRGPEAHRRLTSKGKVIIDALLADNGHRQRFPKTARAMNKQPM